MKLQGNTGRYIFHLDINCFFAAVEMLLHPELRHVPLAICGSKEDRHGIVLTANYIAKKVYNIKTGMVIWEADQLCRNLIKRPANTAKILHFSRRAREIAGRYTDRLEPFGADEFWGDLTGIAHSFDEAYAMVDNITREIYRELGVTVSVGLSNNKITSKLGSDYKKPAAITMIRPEDYERIVYPLPVSDLLYVGRARTKKLAQYRIYTIGDLAKAPYTMMGPLGGKVYEMLWVFANGLDTTPVCRPEESRDIKSVGNSQTTYRDLVNDRDVWTFQLMLAKSVGMRMMEQHFKARKVEVWIRYDDLSGFIRQCTLEAPTNDFAVLAQAAHRLYLRNRTKHKPVRSLGVRGTDLVDATFHQQLSLFEDPRVLEKREDLNQTVFELCSKYGNTILQPGRLFTEEKLKRISPKDDNVLTPPGHFAV